jgi:hypothetical protein
MKYGSNRQTKIGAARESVKSRDIHVERPVFEGHNTVYTADVSEIPWVCAGIPGAQHIISVVNHEFILTVHTFVHIILPWKSFGTSTRLQPTPRDTAA